MRQGYQRILDRYNPSETIAFSAALFAVVLWGLLPVLREQVAQVPPLQTAAIALACAAGVARLCAGLGEGARATAGTEAAALPFTRGLLLAALLVGAIGFYFLGLDWAPPERVTLVTYTWPLMFVAASEILRQGRVGPLVLAGCTLAFAGTTTMVLDQGTAAGSLSASGFSWGQATGYLAGLLSGLCWVGYSLVLRHGVTLGPRAWPRVFGLGALLALLIHLGFETAQWPLSLETLVICAVIGAGPYGLAFVAWAYGVRRGPARMVGALAYAVPFIASGALVALGAADLDWRFAAGGAAILGGVILANRQPEQA
ncbi:DMT family transporter [Fodinicurvata halophila]|uniref:DMT family transporter n=1 Tax=Fodinicurvata halophila TaxID=1419723 RepID=A0ABV8UPS2_9PROT